jgi:arginase
MRCRKEEDMDLHVVGLRYRNDSRAPAAATGIVDAGIAACQAAAGGGVVTVREPELAEENRTDDIITNLGRLGGAIADAVAEGARDGKRVVVVGGNCTALPGVLGGLQDVYGPAARVGLVWFDAHGDCNTPRTTPSGMLGGMPVAVSAGFCYAPWRIGAHLAAPIPTDRIVMVDVRNLDPEEAALVRATDITIARVAPGFAGDEPIEQAAAALAVRCDAIYLHIDSDVLDASLTPNHGTKEPNGPGVAETAAAIKAVMATGKVVAFGLLSVNSAGAGGDISVRAAVDLLNAGLAGW